MNQVKYRTIMLVTLIIATFLVLCNVARAQSISIGVSKRTTTDPVVVKTGPPAPAVSPTNDEGFSSPMNEPQHNQSGSGPSEEIKELIDAKTGEHGVSTEMPSTNKKK